MSAATLWPRLLPLALGAAISPVLLLAQLSQLCHDSAPAAGLRRSGALLLGCLLVVLGWGAAGGWIASRLPPHLLQTRDPAAAVVQLLLGLILASLSLRILACERGRAPVSASDAPSWQAAMVDAPLPGTALLAPLALGLALMASNLSSLLLFLAAAHDLGRSGQAAPVKLLAWLVLDAATLLPVWLPPALVLGGGQTGRRLLQRLGDWVGRHRRGIEATLTAVFAALLIWRGLGDL